VAFLALLSAFSDDRPLMYPRKKPRRSNGSFEPHAVKAVPALAVFVEDRPRCIERTHTVGKLA
jgi:hypothetical protein